jgi:hypothetical protein
MWAQLVEEALPSEAADFNLVGGALGAAIFLASCQVRSPR